MFKSEMRPEAIRSFTSVMAALAFAGVSSTVQAETLDGPILVTAPVEKVFEPLGFDDNDNAEVIVHGHFPNTCYKIGPSSATVDYENGKISVEVTAWYYRGALCAQLMVPYVESVKIGPLPVGNYQIEVVDRPDAQTMPLSISQASSRNPDDFLYAPVDNVGYETDADGNRSIVLEGKYPLMLVGCMKVVEVREQVTPGNVIVVQPIAQLFERDEDCLDQRESKKFRVTQPIAEALGRTEYLAHVRSLAGHSVNRLFDFAE